MKIVIAGGTGFLGTALVDAFAARGHHVVVLTRQEGTPIADAKIRRVHWDPDGRTGAWSTEINGAGAVVNLAGAGLADKRWSAARKAELRASRLHSTRSLVASVRAAATKPGVFVQQSAIGYYGVSPIPTFDEACSPGENFLSDLCVSWEGEAHPLETLGVRLVVLRTGIVLAGDGGALPRLLPPFRFFIGGRLGSGRQTWSWIHLDDWIALMQWAIETPSAHGVYNATAPTPVSNTDFAKAIGHAMHRPSWLPVPAFVLRAIVGEFSTMSLVQGQRVVPKRALDAGFKFKHPNVEDAVKSAVMRPSGTP